ncbi:PRC-barrel domain-containing protein [Methylobacter sp.]|uniref:PRC-barrel domain-containing protein n=1 Tax=Methylobacter sp. TaxID=2051955 RepID=UPI002FDDF0F3
MNFEERDTYGIYKGQDGGEGPGPRLMGADTLLGNDVYNQNNEDLGSIKEIMLDMTSGQVSYAVLSFGGFLGMGERLFAVPWDALKLDPENKRFVLNVAKEHLENAPGFDKDHWPDMADQSWRDQISSYYETQPPTEQQSIESMNERQTPMERQSHQSQTH